MVRWGKTLIGGIALIVLVAGCKTTGYEGLHNVNKKKDIEAVGSMVLEANQRDAGIRREAVKLLAAYSIGEAMPYYKESAKDSNSLVRAQTAQSLGSYNDRRSVPMLLGLAQDRSFKVKSRALRGLGTVLNKNDKDMIVSLRGNLKNKKLEVRLATAELFAKMGSKDGHVEVVRALDAAYYTDIRSAVKTLKYYKQKDDVYLLTKFLNSKDSVARTLAIESIEYIRGTKLDDAALQALKDEASGTRPILQEKPQIFIVFPKGNEEIADKEVDLFGYVNSKNRTDKIEVLINNKPVDVAGLWADFKVTPAGLRGYPLRWKVPLEKGINKIDINVLDQAGFLVNHTTTVKRIVIVEAPTPTTTQVAIVANLGKRLPNLEIAKQDQAVSSDNFMAILEGWVAETAKSDYNKGNSMFDQGRHKRAAYYYRKSVKTAPLGEAYYNLGLAEKVQGNGKASSDAFTQACKLNLSQACNMS